MYSKNNQCLALIARYWISVRTTPISSAFRLILIPAFVIGIVIYVLCHQGTDFMKQAFSVIPTILLVTTLINVYSFGNWLIKDRATGLKSLMLSMGLERRAYYQSSLIIMTIILSPIILFTLFVSLAYGVEGTESPRYHIVILFGLFILHITAFLHAITSVITSNKYSFFILLLLIFETIFSPLINMGIGKAEGFQPFLIFLDLMSPYAPLRIFASSYLINKNNGIIDVAHGGVAAPTILLSLGSLAWIIMFYAFARWFEEVCPWQNDSLVQHPCFCLRSKQEYSAMDQEHVSPEPAHHFEKRDTDRTREVGIRVSRLIKSFKKLRAVDDVSFNIYKGETTLLLGHNGAGKTTMMRLILGLLMPDSGGIHIGGWSNSEGVSVGVCPQESVLDESLTVREHLEVFTNIKSCMDSASLKQHVEETLGQIGLTSHAHKRPGELSGGMKRKLSLGLAFVGNSRVLILDEPSSGLDPDSRMSIWNAIRRYRADRTVLLSTQHMEEADYLGDRIAIMSGGRIICCGSQIFLNKLFGTGYKLRIECLKSKRKVLFDHVQQYFEQAKLSDSSAGSTDLSNVAALNSQETCDFVVELRTDKDPEVEIIKLLQSIEDNGAELGLRSHGLKSSSIEDVMLNTDKEVSDSSAGVPINDDLDRIRTLTDLSAVTTEFSAVGRQIYACLLKSLWTYINDWKSMIFYRIVLPALPLFGAVRFIGTKGTVLPNYSLVIIVAHFIYYPVMERCTKFKTMQLTSHLRVSTYWLSFLISDSATILLNLVTLNLMVHFAFPAYLIMVKNVHLVISIAFILFCLAALAFSYSLSMVMNNHKSCIGYFYLIHLTPVALFLCGMLTTFLVSFEFSKQAIEVLSNFGAIVFPTSAFDYVLLGLSEAHYVEHKSHEDTAVRYVKEDIQDDASKLVMGFSCLSVQIFVYSLLLALAELQYFDLDYNMKFKNLWRLVFRVKPGADRELDSMKDDSDVVEESRRALSKIEQASTGRAAFNRISCSDSQNDSFSLLAHKLEKSYLRGEPVVENLSFTVKTGECFGLLGINGAGKTTSFSMITGESKLDEGRIWANGYFVERELHDYRKHIGFDPQATPDLLLSAEQAISLMARLRGMQERGLPTFVELMMDLLAMSEHRHKVVAKLSGGTKRKLALGMALIGTPSLLVLDEPTAGIDPMARRSIWKILKGIREKKSSIVISSHVMEECEAICDRIAIMSRGRLRCVGSFLHLRSKFARGCTLRIQISSSSIVKAPGSEVPSAAGLGVGDNFQLIDTLVKEISEKLAESVGANVFKVTDKNIYSATFSITDNRVRRSIIFALMRELRLKNKDLDLNYAMNDSSLEDIFISLAREHDELVVS